MKRHYLLTFIIASFLIVVAFHGVNVQAAVSGDELCGGSKVQIVDGKIVSGACGINDIVTIFKGIFSTIIAIGLPLLVIFIMYRFLYAWYQLQQGNANAYKDAIGKVTQAIIGFIIIVALFGGILFAMLKFVGVRNDAEFNPLLLLKKLSVEIIPHAYAAPVPKNSCPAKPEGLPCITDDNKAGFCTGPSQCSLLITTGGQVPKGNCGGNYGTGASCLTDDNENGACYTNYCVKLLPELPDPVATPAPAVAPTSAPAPTPTDTTLPNPLGVDSLYDFILSALSLIMKFFIYPGLIAMWVWSGFNYVLAQGAPEKLSKTHNLLMWAVISTLVVFVAQGFLIAVRGSVEKIVPSSSVVTTPSATSGSAQNGGLYDTNQGIGTICYSDSNCGAGLKCDFNSRGDKGTCQ
ncbi:hypothetical protein K9M47_00155 [Candidatus Gracilibacteria bacterium]|nr:hypothetical protein [Candidatus Gracilibacteria bacterium]MCF7898389.1 hypothetical protein [Candidatus Paceibacterota bacterium]